MATDSNARDEAATGYASSFLNGFRIMEAFSVEEPALGVTELAHRVGMHKSTVSRMLTSLRHAGYVDKDPDTGLFRLGLGVIRLAGPLLAHLDVRRAAQPALESVTAVTGETTALTVWNGAEAIVVEQVTTPRSISQRATIGTRYDRYESSSVRVFLANLPEADAKAFYRSRVYGKSTAVGSTAEYLRSLESVRSAGYAVNDGLTSEDEFGISAPVRDYRNSVVGCITLSAPRYRIGPESLAEVIRHVAEGVDGLSQRLGYYETDV